jgi:anthranilate phosphoribosyltransferase
LFVYGFASGLEAYHFILNSTNGSQNKLIEGTRKMKIITQQLLARESLTIAQSYALFKALASAQELQQGVILALLAAKGETIDEMMGARTFLLEQAVMEPSAFSACPTDFVDLVGTGGDGVGTFNISTAASIVVASCGVYVAKHGGGRVTSRSGSADVMTGLGIPLYLSSSKLLHSLNQHHYAYICASYFNKAFNVFGSIRSQLGFPTIFNVLGPLVNPLRPKRQVIGVYRRDLVPVVAQLLKETGSVHALVVHALEGLDELSVSGPSIVAEVSPQGIRTYTVTPADLGFASSNLQDVLGGTPEENAILIQQIFLGQIQGPKLDIVLLNAAAGLLVADKVASLEAGIEMARLAISSGRTLALLQALRQGDKE